MKRLLLIATISSFIVACGGDGRSAEAVTDVVLTEEQIVEKFNLPAEPDPELNNATIEGIDSNNNDIRDDWERAIAFEYYQDSTNMHLHNEAAKNNSKLNKAYKSGDTDLYQSLDGEQLNILECGYYYYGADAYSNESIRKKGSNTEKRLEFILDRDSEISKYLNSSSYEGLTKEQKDLICPKYKK